MYWSTPSDLSPAPAEGAGAAGLAALLLTAPWLGAHLVEYVTLFPRLSDTSWIRAVIAREEPDYLAAILWSPLYLRALSLATLATVIALGLRARGSGDDETLLHHMALAIAPFLAPFAFVWTTFLVASLPLFALVLARLLRYEGRERVLRIALLAIAWGLLQLVQLHDLVPIAAHLAGVALLLALALGTLSFSSSALGRSMPASRANRSASG